MKTMKRYFQNITSLLLFLALIPGVTSAQESDATYEQVVHEYTFQEDGCVDYHHFSQLKLHTHYAFHRAFGETFLLYDTETERISVREAYTLMKNGKKVPLPSNAINEVLPRMADNAPPYNGLREMVISHTGLERGATIVLDYVRQQLSPSRPFVSGCEVLATDAPIEKMTLIIRHPETMGLFHRLFNADIDPDTKKVNGMIEYRWELQNIPAQMPGPFTSAASSALPAICWSSAASLEAGWKAFAGQAVFHRKTDPALQIILDTLIKAGSSPLEKAMRIWDHVMASSQVWSASLPILPKGPRTPLECWNSGGGTPLEIAMLATAMMKGAGLDAFPVLTLPSTRFYPELAIQQPWTNPLVMVRLPEGAFYFYPQTNPAFSAESALAGHYLLPVVAGTEWTPVRVEDMPAEAHYRFSLQFEEKGNFVGRLEASLANASVPSRDMISASFPSHFPALPKNLKKVFLPEDSRIVMKEAKVAFSLENTDSLALFGKYRRIVLPQPADAPDAIIQRHWPENLKSDMQLPHPIKLAMEWEMSIPEGYRLLVQGKEEEMRNEAGNMAYSVREKGGKWIIRRSLEIPAYIPQTHYSDFRELVITWQVLGSQAVWMVPEAE